MSYLYLYYCVRYVAIFFPLKHLSPGYRPALLAVLLSNWISGLVLGAWQGSVHHAGPASCLPHHQDYLLCGAHTGVAESVFVPLTALYTFLPLLVTVTINSLIYSSLLCRQREEDLAGCAACRLEGGLCQNHQNLRLSREKARLDKLVKMKTVRMTVFTAAGFLLCQVSPAQSRY